MNACDEERNVSLESSAAKSMIMKTDYWVRVYYLEDREAETQNCKPE